jgi:branched-chain amino acid transport system ATP-binding protein
VAGLPAHRIARMGVGRTFQITQTFGSMSVRENVQVALLSYHHGIGSLLAAAPKLHRDEAQELLERVGMASQAERPCAVLAYGDLKRVELAAALAGRPRVLLMDEPTAGMAPEERGLLMELAADMALSERIAVLFTEHDMSVVFGHARASSCCTRARSLPRARPTRCAPTRRCARCTLAMLEAAA